MSKQVTKAELLAQLEALKASMPQGNESPETSVDTTLDEGEFAILQTPELNELDSRIVFLRVEKRYEYFHARAFVRGDKRPLPTSKVYDISFIEDVRVGQKLNPSEWGVYTKSTGYETIARK